MNNSMHNVITLYCACRERKIDIYTAIQSFMEKLKLYMAMVYTYSHRRQLGIINGGVTVLYPTDGIKHAIPTNLQLLDN